MLSRVANCLYWMSRYIERADNIARLMDVTLQLALDFHRPDPEHDALEEHWLPIVQSTGDEEQFRRMHGRATGRTVAEFLVFEPANSNSIVSSVAQARENARMVRDQITVELWEEINRLHLFLRSPRARDLWRTSPSELFLEIRNNSLLLQGLTDATVVRNEGWFFVQVGRYLERADKTSRIIDVRHASVPERGPPAAASPADALGWSAVLRSCSAWDAYKALHGAEVQPALVAEFLLLTGDFPRSVRFSVRALNDALRRISGVSDGQFSNAVEKLAGRLLAELQFSSAQDIFDTGLHRYLDELQVKLNDVGTALFRTYFFQAVQTPEDEQLRQQEEQQQQGRPPPAGPAPA